MSKTEKEMKEEFERDLREGKYETHNVQDLVKSIKPHGVELHEEAYNKCMDIALKNKYSKEIKKDVFVDVYDVLNAFEVTNPAIQHAIKKLLAGGKRGYKDIEQDYHEAIASIYRGIELEKENES